MAYTPTRFFNAALGTTPNTVIYTVPSGKMAILKQIVLSNVTGSAATTTVTINGVGLVPTVTINGNSIFTLDSSQVLNAGDTLQAWASAGNTIAANISGVVIG